MKIELYYNVENLKIKKNLIKLFPQQKDHINNIFKFITINDFIIINDDEIKIKFDYNQNNESFLFLTIDLFNKYTDLLFELKNNSYTIDVNTEEEYNIIVKYFKSQKYIDNIWNRNDFIFKLIITDNIIYVVTNDIYNEFFNNIKIIDASSFIRMIKLNKLNKYEI